MLSPRGMILVGGGVLAGVLAWLLTWLPGAEEKSLNLAGVLGIPEAETRVAADAGNRVESPPLKSLAQGAHPTYPLLHPEMPSALLMAEKTASTAPPVRKPRLRQAPSLPDRNNVRGSVTKSSKKEKAPLVKAKTKKKKPSGKPQGGRSPSDTS
ncbi:MAG: hypothetical protein FJ128_07750 [Deltaproteobacteria bacterium]|nr:hypothetical protein [Deltaproteobacteria bacterium]